MNAVRQDPALVPRVSVIIIFLNGEAFIEEAIESVLDQGFRSFELILVDDGSTDRSSAIARSYASAEPDRIRYTEHRDHANLGMSASRNAGIAIARGELIAFLDADDVWSPDKLQDQVSIFDAHPRVGLVAGATLYWNSWNGGEDYAVQVGNIQNHILEPPTATLSLYPLGKAPAPCPSSFIARRSVIDRVGGFEASYVGRLQMYEDQAFLAKVYLHTPVYFSDRSWIKYRQHDASCMTQVIKGGHYEAVRQHFLTWFAHYCRNVGFTDQRVWRKLRRAEWPYRHPRIHRAARALHQGIRKVWVRARRLGRPLRKLVRR